MVVAVAAVDDLQHFSLQHSASALRAERQRATCSPRSFSKREREPESARWDCCLCEDDLEVQRFEPASIVVSEQHLFHSFIFWVQLATRCRCRRAASVSVTAAAGGCDCALIIKSKRISIVYPNSKRSCTLCGTCAAWHRKKQQQLHNNSQALAIGPVESESRSISITSAAKGHLKCFVCWKRVPNNILLKNDRLNIIEYLSNWKWILKSSNQGTCLL